MDFLSWAVGTIVWVFANVVYLDMRRKGVRGFGRFAAFWGGNPATWLTLFLVKEPTVDRIETPPDDEDRLFREIRVDRELRGLGMPDQPGDGARGGD
jgi:hypothetical protein